jgi:hypothetical protein
VNQEQLAKYERDILSLTLSGDFLLVKIGFVPGMKVFGKVLVGKKYYKNLLLELELFHKTGNTSFLPALYQIANAAALPGVRGFSLGLPDIHCGYGLAIGLSKPFSYIFRPSRCNGCRGSFVYRESWWCWI